MRNSIQGTFHFHSTYSHDGRSTLQEVASTLRDRGFSFCVMTDHFEDFDAPKFERYVQEAKAVSRSSGFLLIPGVEVDLSGLHTIVFPVQEYAEIMRFASGQGDDEPYMFKVLAHPSKYPIDMVTRHLGKYAIDGVELWNQQADGSHLPPTGFLKSLQNQPGRHQYRYFFGCDLHKVNLTVANIISLSTPRELSVEAVTSALIDGDFVTRNLPTGIAYRNGAERTEFDTWLQTLLRGSYYQGKLLRSVRNGLKSLYRILPRDVQHSLNDVKNFVRNKV